MRGSGEGYITEIVFQGEAIPIEHLVAFTYRQGELILLDPIEINDPDRNLLAVIDLPLIPQLAGQALRSKRFSFNSSTKIDGPKFCEFVLRLKRLLVMLVFVQG